MVLILGCIALMIGCGVGALATAQIIYPMFLALPQLYRWKRAGRVDKIPWVVTLASPLVWLAISAAVYAGLRAWFPAYLIAFMVGYGFSGLMILGQLNNPRNREDLMDTYGRYLKN